MVVHWMDSLQLRVPGQSAMYLRRTSLVLSWRVAVPGATMVLVVTHIDCTGSDAALVSCYAMTGADAAYGPRFLGTC
eukprot:3286849-Rhodomonas_salina.2